ncbi:MULTISPECIES: enoyl-CoA hydratase-related protein [unclassified Nocardioides]|uniref:enoyl-CoA hydratase-related protein n=1 Tax=unclassified Nocardioides TaxID=2615069 RepID=UPI0006F88B8A|nr:MULTISPECIES: enoyl-CoA hydratase-related protein [unclassified Nocardioides]KQY57329.1 enoyl-CoA hydratase [Nocardioides sp. Root140]KQZ68844.1 enoyl-CoA hydratase [Nocardioides sp. Root151]KRF20478.1 enoyl-CoA hydratase [Nocardioides sp. Soil796]
MAAQVTCSTTDSIATVTLRNTERRNAVSVQLLGELYDVLGRIEADARVRVVVLTGSGRAFCVGADLAAAPETRSLRGDSVEADTARLRNAARVAERLHQMPQVTIAAINGACAGAGLSLALATDLRIAARSAVFNTAFLAAGLSGDLGAIWFLTRILGVARARELFLLPGKFDATRAEHLGLVTSVADDEELDQQTHHLATRLAAAAPLAARAMKQNLLDATTQPLAAYLGSETERMVRSFHTDDAREAASAFLQRREPAFAGR